MKNIIVICPTCKIRVIPKPDGTCPGCQRDISYVKKNRHNEQLEDTPPASKTTSERLKNFAISTGFTLVIFVLPAALMIFSWSKTKFPPQIFGDNEDHFRGHVIDPIPESVKILDVAFDDIMISPEVAYYFRFYVNRNDLNKIISYNSLQSVKPIDDECSLPSYTGPPEWWKIPLSDSVEAYKYETERLFLKLCYDVSNQIAYYRFWTN